MIEEIWMIYVMFHAVNLSIDGLNVGNYIYSPYILSSHYSINKYIVYYLHKI